MTIAPHITFFSKVEVEKSPLLFSKTDIMILKQAYVYVYV